MAAPAGTPARLLRFSTFELNLEAGELRNKGAKVKIEGQPLQVLQMLLEHPGELITREELKQRLWPADTFVDFDHSINVAIKRLREALNDSAATPRFIETLPRRGYRFICPLAGPAEPRRAAVSWRYHLLVAIAAAAALIIVGLAVNIGGIRDRLIGRGANIRAIAVLPLRDLSGDPEQRYLAAGFTEMVITELGRLHGVEVRSHQSVLRYADTDTPLPQIAGELGVDAVVEGTVLRSGDRVRVTVNVLQAKPERHLLSESYERDFGDVLRVQREVGAAVGSLVRPRLAPLPRPPEARAVNAEVMEAFMRGQAFFAKGTDQERVKAGEWFDKAVAADPQFAPAYAYLALLHSHGGGARKGEGGVPSRVAARRWAEKALQLDDTLAPAHAALGWVELSDWNWAGADREFQRAIELNPGFMIARTWYAQFLACMGRAADAAVQAETVLRLDPVSAPNVSHAAWAMLAVGKVDEAIERLRQSVELEPGYWVPHRYLADGYMRKGMYAEAVAELQIAIGLNPEYEPALGALAYAHAQAGNHVAARAMVRQLEARLQSARAERRTMAINSMVPAYVAVGDYDKAFAYLEDAYERRGGALAMLYTEETFRPLRDDSRFRELAQRVGLPQSKQ